MFLTRDPRELLGPCIFQIWDYWPSRTKPSVSTGFFVSDEGYALTCDHVVEPEIPGYGRKRHRKLKVVSGDQEGVAHVLNKLCNKGKDIAVLEVEGLLPKAAPLGLPFFAGDNVYSLGFQEYGQYKEAVLAEGRVHPWNVRGWPDFAGARHECVHIEFPGLKYGPGMSGAPVLNARTHRVFGLVIGVSRDQPRGYVMELTHVSEEWPEFRRYCPHMDFEVDRFRASTPIFHCIYKNPEKIQGLFQQVSPEIAQAAASVSTELSHEKMLQCILADLLRKQQLILLNKALRDSQERAFESPGLSFSGFVVFQGNFRLTNRDAFLSDALEPGQFHSTLADFEVTMFASPRHIPHESTRAQIAHSSASTLSGLAVVLELSLAQRTIALGPIAFGTGFEKYFESDP